MIQQQIYDELKEIAQQAGLTVRSEIGDFDGGICTIREQRVLLLNKRHPIGRRISVMARALGQIDLGMVFVKPALRDLIDEELVTAGITPPSD
jgi:hypothetical protein